MQVTELKKDGLTHELEVIVTAKDIDKHIDARLVELGKTLRMPGFRPGKVPMAMVKKRYGKAVLGEVLEIAVNDATQKALLEKNLRPAMQPKIEVKEFDEGKDLKYTMAVEVFPEFEVMNLKSIKADKPVAKVEAAKIDEAIERIAGQNRETEEVTEDRAAANGDYLVFDFHGRTADDNKEQPGMHAHGHQLELGSGQFIPGFEEQMIGLKKGDKKEVRVTFPAEYHATELAGREAIFDIEIHELRQAKSSEINDEFAKRLGLDDVKALRDIIEKQMQGEYDQVSRMRLKRAILDALDEGHEFPLPQGMVDAEFDQILRQIKSEKQAENKDEEAKLEDGEEEELRAIAGRRVRLGMVLSEIGRANNIQVADSELNQAVIREAQKYKGQEAQVFEFYRKNRQALDALRAPVFEEKVIDYIVELADISDKSVSVDELTKEDDEDESYLASRKGKAGGKKKVAKPDDGDDAK